MRRTAHIERLQAVVAADPVLHMDDEVAGPEGGDFGQEVLRLALPGGAAGDALAEDVGFGQGGEIAAAEAALQAEHDAGDLIIRQRLDLRPAFAGREAFDAMLFQNMEQAIAAAGRIGGDQDVAPRRPLAREVLGHSIVERAFRGRACFGEVAGMAAFRVAHLVRVLGQVEGEELQSAAPGQCRLPLLGREVEARRRQRMVDAAADLLRPPDTFARLVEVLDLLQAGVAHLGGLVVQADGGHVEVIEQRFHPLMEQRQPMFHTRVSAPLADRLVERVFFGDRTEGLAVASAEACHAVGGQEDLVDRTKLEAVAGPGGTLVERVEAADALDLVAEQIDPVRCLAAGGKEIEQAAALGVLAGLLDGVDPLIAVLFEEGKQRLHRQTATNRELQVPLAQGLPRYHPLQQRVDGGDDDAGFVCLAFEEPAEGGDALSQQIAMRRDAVVGQTVPGRKGQHREIGREESQGFAQAGHALIVAGDVEVHPPPGRLGLRGDILDQQGVEAFRDIGQVPGAALGKQLGNHGQRVFAA